MTTKALIKRYSVLVYFILTFTISWGGVFFVIGPGGFGGTPERFETLLPFVVLALMAGPSVSGIVMTALVGGRSGLRELGSRLLRWRVGARWYAAASLLGPVVVLAVLLVLSLASPAFLPAIFTESDKVPLLLAGLAAGLTGGFFEEPGWTGFAVPRLRRRFGVLTTGLLVGVVWGAWHLLTSLWASGETVGGVPLIIYLPVVLFAFLLPFRVLMVWVYAHTESLLLAMLMHFSLGFSVFYVLVPSVTGWAFVSYYLTVSGALWLVVATVVAIGGEKRSAKLHQRRVA